MNRAKVHFLLTITAFVSLLLVGACSKLCNTGYEGSRCNVLATTKFTGQWAAVDSPGNIIYVDTITQGSSIYDVTLSASFGGHQFNHVLNASVQSDVLTIPYQQPDSGKDFVQGTGTMNAAENGITFYYQIITPDSPQVTANYSGSWVKKN